MNSVWPPLEAFDFFGLRLLNLEYQLSTAPHLSHISLGADACGFIGSTRETNALSCPGLHGDGVTTADQLAGAGEGQGDTIFVVLISLEIAICMIVISFC